MLLISYLLLLSVLLSSSNSKILSSSLPIWNKDNRKSLFAYFRSPIFELKNFIKSRVYNHRNSVVENEKYYLYITANQSPQIGVGSKGSKLPSSYKLYINGQIVTLGPGHNIAYNGIRIEDTQVVNKIDVTTLLLEKNIIAVACYFNYSEVEYQIPRLQAELCIAADSNDCIKPILSTDTSWLAWNADIYHNPTGDSNRDPWYIQPNEFINTNNYPLNWNQINFIPVNTWSNAVQQPNFNATFICLDDPPFVILTRTACNVKRLDVNDYLVDFGQEFSGGVNLTFDKVPINTWVVSIMLGEALDSNGHLIYPTQARQKSCSNWTLSTNPDLNVGIYQHEMNQFRYAYIVNSPTELTIKNVKAWVLQHAVGGTGVNPYEISCAVSTPVYKREYSGGSLISWSSSSTNLDKVFNLTAYTAIATSFDINVDSRSRQRDLCNIDGLVAMEIQNSVFGGNDRFVQRRTTRFAYWDQTVSGGVEFQLSTVMMALFDNLESGSMDLVNDFWSSKDDSILADSGLFVSMQMFTGLVYFNLSGLGLMSYPSNDSWIGSYILVDWPVSTRDGYILNSNTDDSIRNGFASYVLNYLSFIAKLKGEAAKAMKYEFMAESIVSNMIKYMLRYNITSDYQEAYFVDGAIGDATEHAAIHSTIYAAAAGVSDNNPKLATLLSNYLIRRDLGPSSCMTAKWVMIACYRLSQYDPSGSAADYVLSLLERTTYPSWGYMIERGATITMESWRPEDKPNMDWGHPWCAYPASGIPRLLLGVQPIAPGWSEILIRPQPSTLGFINASIPTPLGSLVVNYNYDAGVSVTLLVNVLSQMNVRVCLVYPIQGTQTNFLINDMKIEFYEDGRMICMLQNSYLQNGLNNIQLIV